MEYLSYFFEAVAAALLLMVVAMPHRIFVTNHEKKKVVGPSYWGNYHYAPPEISDEMKRIEVTVHKRRDTVIGGSESYARGRGVKE